MRLAARRGQVVWTQRFKDWPDNDAVSNFVYEQLFCFVLFYFICLLICFILNTWVFLLLICKLLFISPGCCTSCFAYWLLNLLLSNLLHDHKLPCSNVSYFLWAAHMKWMLNHTIKNPKHWSFRTLRAWHNTTAQSWNSRWSSFSHIVLNIVNIWHMY